MFQEYAVEPRVVIDACRELRSVIGIDMARIVVGCPSKWAREVFCLADRLDIPARQRKEVEVFLHLLKPILNRPQSATYEPARPWLENALEEHSQRPFGGILAHENPQHHPDVLVFKDLPPDHSLRVPVRDASVPRNADAMVKAVALLLRVSKTIVFVDPYFQPDLPGKWRRTLPAMFQEANCGRVPNIVEVHASNDVKLDRRQFEKECSDWKSLIPSGLSVRFRLLSAKRGSPAGLHDRFLLTEQATVSFSTGFDHGTPAKANVKQTLCILSQAQQQEREDWHLSDFGPKGAFEEVIPDGVLVVGAK